MEPSWVDMSGKLWQRGCLLYSVTRVVGGSSESYDEETAIINNRMESLLNLGAGQRWRLDQRNTVRDGVAFLVP
jgi:hypothetical protein